MEDDIKKSESPSTETEKQKRKKEKKKHRESEDNEEAVNESSENPAEEESESHHHHSHRHHHSEEPSADDDTENTSEEPEKKSKKSKKKGGDEDDNEEKKKSHKKKDEKGKKSKKKDGDDDDNNEEEDDEKCSVEVAFDIMVISSCRMNGVDLPKEKSYSIKSSKSTGSFMSALCKKEKLLRPDLYELFDPVTNKVIHGKHTFNDVIRAIASASKSSSSSKSKKRVKLVLRLSEVLDSDGEDDSGSKSASTGSSRSASSNGSGAGDNVRRRDDDADSCSSGSTAVSGVNAKSESRSMTSRGGARIVPVSGYYRDSKENRLKLIFGTEKLYLEAPEYLKFKNGFASNYSPDVTATSFLLGEQHGYTKVMPNLRWASEWRKKIIFPMTKGSPGAVPIALRNLGLGALTRDKYIRIPPRTLGTQGDRYIPGLVVRDTSNTMIQAKTRVLIWCHEINDSLESSIPFIKEYSSGGKIDVIAFEYRGRGIRSKESAWRNVYCSDILDDLTAVFYHAMRFWPSATFVLYGNGLGADLALNFTVSLYSIKDMDPLTKMAKDKLSVVVCEEPIIMPETINFADRYGEIVSLPIIFASTQNTQIMRTMPSKFKFVHPFFKTGKTSQENTNAIVTKIVDFMATMDSERQKRVVAPKRISTSSSSSSNLKSEAPAGTKASAGVAPSSFTITGDLHKTADAIERKFRDLKDDTENFREWLRRRGFDAMLTEAVFSMGARTLGQFVALYANEKPEPDNADYVKMLALEGAWNLTLCTESWKDIKKRFAGFARTRSFAERTCRVTFAELPRNWHVSASAIRSMAAVGSMSSFPTFAGSSSSGASSTQRFRKDTSSRNSSNKMAATQSGLRKTSVYSGEDGSSHPYSTASSSERGDDSSSSESSSGSGRSGVSSNASSNVAAAANTDKHRKSHHHKH